MRLLATSLALLMWATAVVAQVGPSTRGLTCQSARQLVASRGAIVLNTSPTTYDRYVSSSRYCALDEIGQQAWVPTADIPQCPVGFVCRGSSIERFD